MKINNKQENSKLALLTNIENSKSSNYYNSIKNIKKIFLGYYANNTYFFVIIQILPLYVTKSMPLNNFNSSTNKKLNYTLNCKRQYHTTIDYSFNRIYTNSFKSVNNTWFIKQVKITRININKKYYHLKPYNQNNNLDLIITNWILKENNILKISFNDFFINFSKNKTTDTNIINKLKLLGNLEFVSNNNLGLNFEYVSNSYVLHIKMEVRNNVEGTYHNFIDYKVKLYYNNPKNLYEGFKGENTYNINYNLKLIKEEIWCEYHFDLNLLDTKDKVIYTNILLNLINKPREFIFRHIYKKKYYTQRYYLHDNIRLNLKKGIILLNNNNNYKFYTNLDSKILNFYKDLVINKLNINKNYHIINLDLMYHLSKFLYIHLPLYNITKFNKQISTLNITTNKNLLNNNTYRKNDNLRWLHGYIPDNYFYLSLIYKNNKLILFNHLQAKILYIVENVGDFSEYSFIKYEIKKLIIKNLFISPIKKVLDMNNVNNFLSIDRELINKVKLTILLPPVNEGLKYARSYNQSFINLFLTNLKCENTNIEVLPFNTKSKNFPPVITFILKNWDSLYLQKLIFTKLIKKEKDLENKNKLIKQIKQL
jgi:hypothetical protein